MCPMIARTCLPSGEDGAYLSSMPRNQPRPVGLRPMWTSGAQEGRVPPTTHMKCHRCNQDGALGNPGLAEKVGASTTTGRSDEDERRQTAGARMDGCRMQRLGNVPTLHAGRCSSTKLQASAGRCRATRLKEAPAEAEQEGQAQHELLPKKAAGAEKRLGVCPKRQSQKSTSPGPKAEQNAIDHYQKKDGPNRHVRKGPETRDGQKPKGKQERKSPHQRQTDSSETRPMQATILQNLEEQVRKKDGRGRATQESSFCTTGCGVGQGPRSGRAQRKGPEHAKRAELLARTRSIETQSIRAGSPKRMRR